MREILIVLTVLTSLTGICQNTEIRVLQNDKPVGTNLTNGAEIYSTEYVFPEEIYRIYYDNWTGYVTLKLRGLKKSFKRYNTGSILQYDLERKTALWSKPVSYLRDDFHFYDNAIIKNTGQKSFFLDVHSGREIWEVKNSIYFIEPIDNIAIGYKLTGSLVNSNDLQGIDLKTGNVIWERNLLQDYGWNDFFYLNDSILVVVASGLNTLNIYTGKGWNVNMKTTKDDYAGMIAANAIGIASGLLTGTFFISTGHEVITGLVSNVLVDSTHIYLASHENLIKVDKNTGDITWNYQFGNNPASKSAIFIHDNILLMVNLGMAYAGMDQIAFGKTFFAAFDKETGQQLFFSEVYTNNSPILDYEIRNGEIFFLFKNKIMNYAIKTGSAISEQFFPTRIGDFEYFIGEDVYVETEDEYFMRLRETDTRYLYIQTKADKTIALDNQFNIMLEIDNKFLNLNYLEIDTFKFITKGNNTLVINDAGQALTNIEASKKAFLIGHTLYDTKDNRLIAIDLNEVLKIE